jgi:hypothetical protein
MYFVGICQPKQSATFEPPGADSDVTGTSVTRSARERSTRMETPRHGSCTAARRAGHRPLSSPEAAERHIRPNLTFRKY